MKKYPRWYSGGISHSKAVLAILLFFLVFTSISFAGTPWWRELQVGILQPGALNVITDVNGVQVGQVTLIRGTDCRTGVTVIMPHEGNIFREKVPAAIWIANGFGKLTGISQIDELGVLETPLVLTNTLSVPVSSQALIDYTLGLPGNESVRSVNPVVGETNDGYLNDIRAGFVEEDDVLEALENASTGAVAEGTVGAGTGTVCLGFKGGIGTASRRLPENLGGYTVGSLVQTNFGGILEINGVPIGRELGRYYLQKALKDVPDGSCMMVVATDAPLNSRQLKRLAKRAFQGFVRSGGLSTNGSGDYVIAFSTAPEVRDPYISAEKVRSVRILRDEALSPLFLAAAEATEEAIYHSLFAATDVSGFAGHEMKSLPLKAVKSLLKKYNRYHLRSE